MSHPSESSATPQEETSTPASPKSATGRATEGQPPAEQANDKQPAKTLDDVKPWTGKATAVDKVLLGALVVVPLFYLALMPLRPFFIAKAPVILALVTGAKTVVAGAGAFAAVEQFSVLWVIAAGLIGMMKFDWLWWLAGSRWGDGVVRLFAATERQQRQFEAIRKLPKWLLVLLLFISRWPGVPGAIVGLISGWSGIRMWVFFLVNGLGSATLATVCALVGYMIGKPAVDFLQLIDKYSGWVAIGIIVLMIVWSKLRTRPKPAKPAAKPAKPANGTTTSASTRQTPGDA